MFKNTLFLFGILLVTGCAERGYQLTVNDTTNTITAEKTIDMRATKTDTTKADINHMQEAVKTEQRKSTARIKPPETKKVNPAHKENPVSKQQEMKNRAKSEKKLEQEKQAQLLKNEEEKALLAIKAIEEKKAEQEKVSLEHEVAQKKKLELENAKKAALLEAQEKQKNIAQKEQQAKEVLANKLATEKQAEVLKETEEKNRLELDEKRRKEAHEQKLENDKKLLAQQKTVSDEEKENRKDALQTTESLIFKPSTQTYQTFGTSEIHGHVIYLSLTGDEILLKNTKIYLVAQDTKMDYWYTNFYLKNKQNSSLEKTVVNYLNATHLNLERNFAFYGLAPGNFYVIIESDYPSTIAKNKKLYIAKRITVEKYKKIMTVFSKKL